MELTTDRLILHPLTPAELSLWLADIPLLEQELTVSYRAEPMTGIFKQIVCVQRDAAANDPAHYAWHSFWLMIRTSDRVVVGSAVLKGVPNALGEAEIGYGTGSAFTGQGYMTEAVAAICGWALSHGADAVIAETDRDNPPSHRVLERCGFTQYAGGETLWWRKK